MKRAISPVVATLIIVTVGVAVSIMYGLWLIGAFQTFSDVGGFMIGEEPRKERVYELGEHKVTLHADGTYYVAIISSDGRTLSVWNTSKPTVEFGLRSAIYTFKIFDSDGLLVREFEMYIVKDTDLLIP